MQTLIVYYITSLKSDIRKCKHTFSIIQCYQQNLESKTIPRSLMEEACSTVPSILSYRFVAISLQRSFMRSVTEIFSIWFTYC